MNMSLQPGTRLAYTSNASGRPEVSVQPFPDAGGRQWPISTNGGFGPRWSSDASELFYITTAQRLAVAGIEERGEAIAVVSRNELFSVAEYDFNFRNVNFGVAPDARFVMIRRLGAVQDLVRVQNWLSELEGRSNR